MINFQSKRFIATKRDLNLMSKKIKERTFDKGNRSLKGKCPIKADQYSFEGSELDAIHEHSPFDQICMILLQFSNGVVFKASTYDLTCYCTVILYNAGVSD